MHVTKDGILELEQRRFKAMCDGDADALGALLHADLTYTHSSGAVDSKESYTRASATSSGTIRASGKATRRCRSTAAPQWCIAACAST